MHSTAVFCYAIHDPSYPNATALSVTWFRPRSHAKREGHSTRRLPDRVELLRLYTERKGVEAVDTHHRL